MRKETQKTPKKDSSKKKPLTGSRQRVWRITDFREIFEMSEDYLKLRTGPLAYTKSFVSLSGRSKDSEIRHVERLEELRSRPDRHLLRSAFEDLKNWAGKKPLEDRGYLVTAAGKPASHKYVAGQLKLDPVEFKKAMLMLERIGLIERVDMDTFVAERVALLKRKRSKRTGKSDSKEEDKHRQVTGQRQSVQNDLKQSGIKQKPFKKENGKDKGIEKEKNREPNGSKTNAKVQKGTERETGESPSTTTTVARANALEGRGQAQEPEEPADPTESDALGQDEARPLAEPALDSVNRTTAVLRPGSVQSVAEYGRHDMYFAKRVFHALSLPGDPDNGAIDETTSLASVWHKIRQPFCRSPPAEDQLAMRLLKEAERITCRKSARNKAATWINVARKISNERAKEI
jgi:hypothetical protein